MDPEIVNSLPATVVEKAYDDVISPTGRQLGKLTEDLVKALRLVSAPIQLLASYQDRLEGFLKRSVQKVPEPSRVEAPAEIAGPILEKIKYLNFESELAEMFSNLLASSIDERSRHNVQASFVYILNQLSHEEATMLTKIFPGPFSLKERGIKGKISDRNKILADEFGLSKGLMLTLLTHLESLGLISLTYDNVLRARKKIVEYDIHTLRRIDLTPYGILFMQCCLRLEKGDA